MNPQACLLLEHSNNSF